MKKNLFFLLTIFGIVTLFYYTVNPSKSLNENKNIVEITYWQFWTGFEKEPVENLINQFNSEHKNIKVKMVTISEPWKKTLLSIIGGAPPDIVNTTSEWLPDLAARGALIPIDDYCKKHKITRNLFIPVYWDMLIYKGKLYGLPLTPSSTAIYWNKNLFKKAGLNPEDPPQTPQEIETYSSKLTLKNPDGKIKQIGFLPSWPSWGNSFYPLQFGGMWGDNEKSLITANHIGNIKGWEWAQSFSKKLGVENIQSFQEEFGNIQGPNNPFYSEKIAIEIGGEWEGNFISKFAPKLNWGAAVAHTEDGKPTTSVICVPIVIPKGAKHPDEAFYFISWLMKKENIEKLNLGQKKFSPLLISRRDDFIKNHPNPYIKVFIDAACSENATYFPSTTAFQLYKREMKNGFSKVMRLEESPVKVLNEIQMKVIKELDRQEKYEKLRVKKS